MKNEDEAMSRGEKELFSTGDVNCTDAAWKELEEVDLTLGLARHVAGLWGEISPEDWAANDRALACGGRLLSRYISLATGNPFWIITEADRSSTTILLPADY